MGEWYFNKKGEHTDLNEWMQDYFERASWSIFPGTGGFESPISGEDAKLIGRCVRNCIQKGKYYGIGKISKDQEEWLMEKVVFFEKSGGLVSGNDPYLLRKAFCMCCNRFIGGTEKMTHLRSSPFFTEDGNRERHTGDFEWYADICVDCDKKIKDTMNEIRE